MKRRIKDVSQQFCDTSFVYGVTGRITAVIAQ